MSKCQNVGNLTPWFVFYYAFSKRLYTDADESIEARGLHFGRNFYLHITFLVYCLLLFYRTFTCVALAKAGLAVCPLSPSVRLSVRLSARLSAALLGCLVCAICNSNSFHSFILKLCLMIVHTLEMCTSYFVPSLCNL